MTERTQPNILITGTPGTGKTTHAELIASELNLKHLNIGDLVREHELHDGYDEEFDAFNMNDDKVCNLSNIRYSIVDAHPVRYA
jgi:adenylate kinase